MVCVSMVALADDPLDRPVSVDIAPQALGSALTVLSQQSEIQVQIPAGLIGDQKTEGLHGKMPLRDALTQLLKGSALRFRETGHNTIGIDAAPISAVATGAAPVSSSTQPATQLAELVVTANKRKESTRTIPASISAITKKQLDDAGASSLSEYLSLAPGANYDQSIPGFSVINIRGISTDTLPTLVQSAVGQYYDDIPLANPGVPISAPDIDAFDAARIEVLRGPQGALYGSASLGGAINYVPSVPDTQDTEFSLFGSGDHIKGGARGGTSKFMLNAPMFSGLAGLRFVGYDNYQPGYIDNVGTGVPHSNSSHNRGGRVAFALSPTSNQTLTVSGLYSAIFNADLPNIDSRVPGNNSKTSLFPETVASTLTLYDLHYQLDTRYGSAYFIGGYQKQTLDELVDATTELGAQATGLQIPAVQAGDTKGYSGELRILSPPSETYKWLAGLSYIKKTENFLNRIDSQTLDGVLNAGSAVVDPVAGLLPGLPIAVPTTTTLDNDASVFYESATVRAPERALFFDSSYRFFHALTLSAGGRAYINAVNSHTDSTGALTLVSGSPEVIQDYDEKAKGFNPKVSIAYDVTRGIFVYASYSKGYRLGGVNLAPNTPVTPGPPTYNPDQLKNYEIGTKTRFWGGKLTADVALYQINWKDIPLITSPKLGVFNYIQNAGNAQGRGIEASLAVRPFRFLTDRVALAYSDAHLINDFTPVGSTVPVPAGTQLPGAPKFTATNTLVGEWHWRSFDPTAAFIYRYVGGSPSSISYIDSRVGNYILLDARAGLKYRGLSLTLFGKNLTDKRGVTARSNATDTVTEKPYTRDFITQPLTLGVELSYTY